ncbi:LamG domain-containing protein [Pedobacter puniceum]|uniref:LamG-like jellyroll fold domain-containing protein n=1 Tax=Pedobacter puniceum TaxID=2666136 RepID=A0A7K0FSD8_9SPHI|nr:LamG domain-containing protein [Pedobacter puniceum]MRX48551.1 hypothetical protein [Pedobacter puniceum]
MRLKHYALFLLITLAYNLKAQQNLFRGNNNYIISKTSNNGLGAGNALQFSSPNRYIDCGTSSSLNITGSMTIELWINPSQNLGIGQWDRLVHRYYPTGYYFGGRAGATNALAVVLNGDLNTAVTPNNTVVPNTWQHVAFTYDVVSKTITIYRNGLAVSTTIWNGTITGSTNNSLTLSAASEAYNGMMDEVRIWNICRSAAQILANYNTTVPINSSGLVAYYKFDEGSGATTSNSISNDSNGSLINSPSWIVPSTAPIN